MRFLTTVLAIAIALISYTAQAADICEAVALYNVPSVEDAKNVLKRGEIDTAVTQYRVDRKTGQATICSHGGSCYPTHVLIDGKMVEALILTNCKVGKPDTDNDVDYQFYSVDVIRSRVAPKELAVDDLDNKLLELGLSSADAGNAAYSYVYRPRTKCGTNVRLALAGSKAALERLTNGDVGCQDTAASIHP